ncbi:DUF2242 domain-containing protein [Roseateles sp. GG27B]
MAAILAAVLTGCSFNSPFPAYTGPRKPPVYLSERFQSDETFSRLFDGNVAETCEAARRALLSQGYVITQTLPGGVSGRKNFQPDGEVHVEISITVVCVPDGRNDLVTTAYVSAQQDRYALKKNTNSTSIGVSALGSISVPMSSTDDSLVKVASETIPAGVFYDRYFSLMTRLLTERAGDK